MIEVVVAGLSRPPGATGVLLLLKELEGPRMLPVGIGAYEAEAIALHFQGFPVPRPLTHDLLAQVLVSLKGELRRVELSALEQGTFYARLMVDQAGHQLAIDSRPSDAVALRCDRQNHVRGPGDKPRVIGLNVLWAVGRMIRRCREEIG